MSNRKKEVLTDSSYRSKNFGIKLAKNTLKAGAGDKKAVVFGLVGDLGAGKTTFLQGFAKGLGVKEKISSPTFVIMRRFQLSNQPFSNFYHLDCYRISKPREILDLGWKEIVENPKNIVAVEWADRVLGILPRNTVMIEFKSIGKNQRKIIVGH